MKLPFNKPWSNGYFLGAAALFCAVAAFGVMPDDANARMSQEEALQLQVGSLALLDGLMLLAGGVALGLWLKRRLACWAFCAATFLFACTPFFYAVPCCQEVLSLTEVPDVEPEYPEP